VCFFDAAEISLMDRIEPLGSLMLEMISNFYTNRGKYNEEL
jgi:hypothetical protein